MLESKKDMLLKGVCCLMLLQTNGAAKANTQISATEKQFTYLKKGFPIRQPSRNLPKEALPTKSEIMVKIERKKENKKFDYTTPFFDKKNNLIQRAAIQRRVCMRGK